MLILRHTVLLIDSTSNDATNAKSLGITRIIVHLIRYAAVFVALILIFLPNQKPGYFQFLLPKL